MFKIKPKYFFITLLIASTGLLLTPKAASSSYTTASMTWGFADASDFTISDAQKLFFSRGSVKFLPTGFVEDWAKIWHDESFAPNPGSTTVRDIAIDYTGNIYISGLTNDGAGGTDYGLILKLDQNFKEVWYKRDYFPGAIKGEVFRITFADDGKLVAHGGYIDGEGHCSSRLMKIEPGDGSVIWSKDIAQPEGVIKISGWDRAAGPVFDPSGNIYIAHANNTGPGQEDAEPTGIYKFNKNGVLLWQATDYLSEHLGGGYAWEDIWDMVVDSDGSAYLSITVSELGVGLRWGLLKYDFEGNFQWVKVKNWETDKFQAPRGIAIDSQDYIYQNGNAGNDVNKGAGCGIRKYNPSGEVLHEEILTDIPLGNGTYCWGSAVNHFDYWIMPGQYYWQSGAYLRNHRTNDLSKFGFIEHLPGERFLAYTQRRSHVAFDRFSNSYGVYEFKDTEYNEKNSVVVLKGKNTYPDTTWKSGTPLSLVNKTPFAFEDNLSGFSVTYGDMDQADVRFQISNNGVDWYIWSGGKWQKALSGQTNTAEEVNQYISSFYSQFGGGSFYFKAFMITDGSLQVDLASVTLEYFLLTADKILPETGRYNKSWWGSELFFYSVSWACLNASSRFSCHSSSAREKIR